MNDMKLQIRKKKYILTVNKNRYIYTIHSYRYFKYYFININTKHTDYPRYYKNKCKKFPYIHIIKQNKDARTHPHIFTKNIEIILLKI